MRIALAAVLGLLMAGPAVAQGIGETGRMLLDQVIPRQSPNEGRDPYEQGRRDEAEQARRREEAYREQEGRRRADDVRRDDRGDARRFDDRGREREIEPREADRRRAYEDERARSGRY